MVVAEVVEFVLLVKPATVAAVILVVFLDAAVFAAAPMGAVAGVLILVLPDSPVTRPTTAIRRLLVAHAGLAIVDPIVAEVAVPLAVAHVHPVKLVAVLECALQPRREVAAPRARRDRHALEAGVRRVPAVLAPASTVASGSIEQSTTGFAVVQLTCRLITPTSVRSEFVFRSASGERTDRAIAALTP